jgi:hypothetical protein
MIARALVVGISAFVLAFPSVARADASTEARADALFAEGKRLRNAGRYREACSKFAQCQGLSPGVGVALSLGDCYEKIGRTASAWQEFRTAEQLARARNDASRADAAHKHVVVLEPTLPRLTIEVPRAAATHGVEVQFDGAPISTDAWNVALAVDPGDHVVEFAVAGQAVRTLHAHVDAAAPSATVRFAAATETAKPAPAGPTPASAPVTASVPTPATAPAPPATAPATAPTLATAPVPATPPTTPSGTSPTSAPANGFVRPLTQSLVAAGFVGVGLGATLLALDGGSGHGTHPPDSGMVAGAAIALSVGGAAFASAFVLHFTAPRAHGPAPAAAVLVAPVPLAGGAGAFLQATF